MEILFLGYRNSSLIPWLQDLAHIVRTQEEPLTQESLSEYHPDFAVSFGYRHILSEEILALLPSNAVNLHISLLPWNRGQHPNFWSIFDGTPTGVSIHLLDKGVDTGDLLAQREISLNHEKDTLSTSYWKLRAEVEALFKEIFKDLTEGKLSTSPQSGQGTVHRAHELTPWFEKLRLGWDTPIAEVRALGRQFRASTTRRE